MHFMAEYVEDDYVFHVGVGEASRSWWAAALASVSAIDYAATDMLVVALKEDFRRSVPDRRLFEGLAQYVLTPLMRVHKLSKESVVFIDDVTAPDGPALALQHPDQLKRFVLSRSLYYDHNILVEMLNRFQKR
jgi:hypothetical protein